MKVSVLMITYNHENYIRQAIEGVLMQKVNFDFELVIANDASPDNSDSIINDVIKINNTNAQINYIKRESNLGINSNYFDAYSKCQGKYIATCEGDDYWIDPFKLQKQVDFLEANPEYVIHSGKAKLLEQNKFQEIVGNPLSKNIYEMSDFSTRNNLINCTVMYRRVPISFKPLKNLIFGDWMLYVLLLSKKSSNLAYCSDEVYSVYRLHPNGIMQTLKKQYDNYVAFIHQFEAVKKYSNTKYTEEDIEKINYYCLFVFKKAFINKNYIYCCSVFFKNFFLTRNKSEIRKYLYFTKRNLFMKYE